MDKYSESDILLALETIRYICAENREECGKCPFFKGESGDCGIIDDEPCEWVINGEEEIWRALL